MQPSVLFVSKPVDPPINDGTKHIVTTIASHLTRYDARVMTTRKVSSLEYERVQVDPIYAPASSYAPSVLNNVRAARHLALERQAQLWNFVFAPNLRSSQMGRWLKAMRRIPVVQTVASRPREFTDVQRLLFGDVVVAQSEDTRRRLQKGWLEDKASGPCPRIEVILPPLGDVRVPTLEDTTGIRRSLQLGPDVPILLYPGDIEFSHGARLVKAAASIVTDRHPTAIVVFAYRDKTRDAGPAASQLMRDLNPKRVRLVREAADILALVRTSAAVLFPVDDLYGKVDLPIILLEAMALSTPVVTVDVGPLAELRGVEQVPLGDPIALANASLALIDDHARRARCIDTQLRAVRERHDAQQAASRYESVYDTMLRWQTRSL
jgi:phosphatidylinositol alpha-1,6-mannosyltransferase